MRVYPAMDLLGGKVVRLHKGDYDAVTVYRDDPVAVVTEFVAQGATRVHVVDLDGARAGEPVQARLVERVLRETGASVQVGGGVRSMSQLTAYREAGAERIVLGTAAVKDPGFVALACAAMPVVVAVDARDGWVATTGWTETSTVRAGELAQRAHAMGAHAVLYTDIARDGTGHGVNVDATAALAREVPGLEVIASGGIAGLSDLRALADAGVIAACVVGRALYERAFTVAEGLAAVRGDSR